MTPDFFHTLIYGWIAIAVLVFFILLKIPAPYGRHTTSKWGPLISNRLGWVMMEATVLLVLFAVIVGSGKPLGQVPLTMVVLFTFHYMYRAFVYPFRLHTKGKKMPLLIAASAMLFNLANGFFLGYEFTHFANYPESWYFDPRFLIGTLVFFIGMMINWRADNMLIALRKPGETHYTIPRTWLFDKISCPNLFGEFIEWLGFAILCWNLPALAFFLWTSANLIPRALSHHQWYKAHFAEYPSQRKAILPGLL